MLVMFMLILLIDSILASSMGMLIVNSIEKSNLMINPNNQLDFTGSGGNGGGHAWAARIILFMGFSLLAGGLAGSFMVLY